MNPLFSTPEEALKAGAKVVFYYPTRWERLRWWLKYRGPDSDEISEYLGMKISVSRPRLWLRIYRRLRRGLK